MATGTPFKSVNLFKRGVTAGMVLLTPRLAVDPELSERVDEPVDLGGLRVEVA